MNPRQQTVINPAEGIRLNRAPSGDLILTLKNGTSFGEVQVVRAAPISEPNRYICFLDSAGEEICMVRELSELSPADRLLAEEELRSRYLTSELQRVVSASREASTLYYEIDTDRGRREIVVRSSDETIRWIGKRHLLLIDVDGNRFQVRDIDALDSRSARMLADNLW